MMSIPNANSDQKAVSIFAQTIYRELRQNGYSGEHVMHLAGELLSLLTRDVKAQNSPASE